MSKVIKHQPVEAVEISPECIAVANAYLETQSISSTAARLRLSEPQVSQYLNKKEVRRYIDNVYLDMGYRNRFKLAATLDNLIEKKLLELEEAEVSSSKDIADLLMMAHKMRMDEMKTAKELLELETKTSIGNQVNVQINETPYGQGNYGALMEKLLNVSK